MVTEEKMDPSKQFDTLDMNKPLKIAGSLSMSPYDPYYVYMRLPSLPKLVERAFQPGYSTWETLGVFLGRTSINESLPPRDKPLPTDADGNMYDTINYEFLHDRTYYPERRVGPRELGFRHMVPFLRNPLNEIFSPLMTSAFSKCSKLEMKALECLEFHGVKNGSEICVDYYDDFKECMHNMVQDLRHRAITREKDKRYLEYLAGKREYDTVFKPVPKPHALPDPVKKPFSYTS